MEENLYIYSFTCQVQISNLNGYQYWRWTDSPNGRWYIL